jgi:hypothetical protein
LDARQILGQITSKVAMPIMSIAKNKAEIIAELEEKNEPIINLTVENVTQSNLCGTTVGEDPWGGCPIATGDIYSVYVYAYGSFFDFTETVGSWSGYSVKFKGGDCVNASYTGSCIPISSISPNPSAWTNSGGENYLVISDKVSLVDGTSTTNVGKKCSAGNWFYVYKNSDCKN